MRNVFDQRWPPMFLVRVQPEGKPQVYRVDSREVLTVRTGAHGHVSIRRHQPRAWWVKPNRKGQVAGMAAVADSVEAAHRLIAGLRRESEGRG